jgi:DNA-binding response OmpR family regulator
MKILIADDNSTNRRLIRATIQNQGYEILEVADGAAALAAIELSSTPLVALIDWEMPQVDGLEVCRQARLLTDGPPVFLILVTIRDSRKDIVMGLQSGAHDYIVKPFDYPELLARVKIGVSMVQLQQQLIDKANELQEALDKVKILSGLLPICSYCSKIKDKDHWERIDTYVSKHSEIDFSHGICPECYQKVVVPEYKKLGIDPEQEG